MLTNWTGVELVETTNRALCGKGVPAWQRGKLEGNELEAVTGNLIGQDKKEYLPSGSPRRCGNKRKSRWTHPTSQSLLHPLAGRKGEGSISVFCGALEDLGGPLTVKVIGNLFRVGLFPSEYGIRKRQEQQLLLRTVTRKVII
ncbi:hypothetical protein AXG93_3802s1080 [Marchantia polymorpha subsp. ruderalis]|uniref:Uncharacterized protein n=1 Tax=Marchantia polymorpha subsp. ruderalis TaxID=1480154 RepID=A0A176VJS6_MARPO|nr:hypothetical protein AXG93_3802s1080 [Marchantia polymorpha subsp. ruderalis]